MSLVRGSILGRGCAGSVKRYAAIKEWGKKGGWGVKDAPFRGAWARAMSTGGDRPSSFYLVSQDGNPAHNKVPTPSSFQEFCPDKPACWILHGVFGGGKNWIPFVKNYLVEKLPGWQFVLVDVRGHGESRHAEGPHTLAECASDVDALSGKLGRAPDVIIGHSLGGKIAIEYLEHAKKLPLKVWVLDSWAEKLKIDRELEEGKRSAPSWGTSFLKDLRPGAAATVLRHLEEVKMPIESRTVLMKELESKGHCRQTCAWMSSNLKKSSTGGGLEWTFSLPAVRQLIYDAAGVDSLETMKRATSRVVYVRAGKGMRWNEDALDRLKAGLAENPLVTHKVIETAAHWLHVDSPKELADLIMPCFDRINKGEVP